MQVACPVCETQVDYETVEITDKSFYCPTCEMDVSIEGLISSQLVSKFDDSPTRTMTVDVSKGVEVEKGSFIGKFEILEEVGAGGFGSVYKARDRELDRVVALKVPKGSAASEINAGLFLREAQLAASVRDPNIVVVHEIGKDGDRSFICSDFIDGATLKAWAHQTKPSVKQCCKLIIRIAKSLQRAHDAKLIHRDLKPANILMDSDGNPFITDFGLAKRIVTDEIGNVLASQTGGEKRREIVGTPAYMSPEQAIGDLSLINKKTDIYSLGVILYELVVGKRPFNGSSASLIQDVLYQDPEKPLEANEKVPKALSAIIEKAMSKNQRDRFESAAEFAEDLQRFVDGAPTKTSPLTLAENVFYQMSKHRMVVVVCLAVVLAVCITAVTAPFTGRVSYAAPFVVPPAEKVPMAKVTITTEPARATIAIVPIHPEYRTPMLDEMIQPDQVTPVTMELPAGDFIIEAYMPGMKDGGVFEVRRSVSGTNAENGESMEFRTIPIVPVDTSGLSVVQGDTLDVPTSTPYQMQYLQAEERTIKPFLIQTTEVTCKQYTDTMEDLPYYLKREKDAEKGDQFPVTFVQLKEARAYAEKIGMRLMEYEEYYLLASKGLDPAVFIDAIKKKINCWDHLPVKSYSQGIIEGENVSIPIYGLFTNVAEMTNTTRVSDTIVKTGFQAKFFDAFVITGAPKEHLSGNEPIVHLFNVGSFGYGSETDLNFKEPLLGFRCVKSLKPRFIKLKN